MFSALAKEFGLYLTPEEACSRSWGAISPGRAVRHGCLTEEAEPIVCRRTYLPAHIYLFDVESRDFAPVGPEVRWNRSVARWKRLAYRSRQTGGCGFWTCLVG